jgi:hypothetical protein
MNPDPKCLDLLGVKEADLPELQELLRVASNDVESAFSLASAA